MDIIRLDQINARNYEGSLVFLYGDEVADRELPLSRKELALLKQRRDEDRNCILTFDRLPYRLYLLSFNSELPSNEACEHLRRSAMKLLPLFEADHAADLAVSGAGILPEEAVAFVEGLVFADYRYDRFKTKKPFRINSLSLDPAFISADELALQHRLWQRIDACRDWVNTPPADLNAPTFARLLADQAAAIPGVSCTVMEKKQIESLAMGGLLAVNRGSVDEPRFVVLEYNGTGKTNQPICLVGKGIMYDTGGLNIKPEDYMQEMKSDMAGAATMASVLFAAAENQLPVHLVALLPMTDNRPGFNAYAADDVLTMYDGTTVEVVNTDAEGRLILADAIAYAVRNFNPRLVITAATLTGAAVRAISTFGIAAMQTHADNDIAMMRIVGDEVYERIVEFPMWKEYDELIKSDIADLRNCGTTPQAGTISAGKFLAHFAKETPFIHLDIAGVAFFSKAQHFWHPGASGYGIRLLYAFLQMQNK
jgi:leucyl aminopeptidase